MRKSIVSILAGTALAVSGAAFAAGESPGSSGSPGASDQMQQGSPSGSRMQDQQRQRDRMNQPEQDSNASGTDAGDTYVVKKGDTLQKIAKEKLGDSSKWQQIAQQNHIQSPSDLRVGQRLTLPENDEGSSRGFDQRDTGAGVSSGPPSGMRKGSGTSPGNGQDPESGSGE